MTYLLMAYSCTKGAFVSRGCSDDVDDFGGTGSRCLVVVVVVVVMVVLLLVVVVVVIMMVMLTSDFNNKKKIVIIIITYNGMKCYFQSQERSGKMKFSTYHLTLKK